MDAIATPSPITVATQLARIAELDAELTAAYAGLLQVDRGLTRALVSFQANKTRPTYRWYKFKEGFSAALVEHLLRTYGVTGGRVLDPFAGSGTTLFVAGSLGLDADGIELLPLGQEIITTRQQLTTACTAEELATLRRWAEEQPWRTARGRQPLPELRITKGAYPPETRGALERYLGAARREPARVQAVLRFALLGVLEAISYTRKDGQYLRWDIRAGRQRGAKIFQKSVIEPFDTAVSGKLREMLADVTQAEQLPTLPDAPAGAGELRLFRGSCLEVLPTLPADSYRAILTSPPYCNRYDYTRTYALELALLGASEEEVIALRQQMLSCTVENRAKDLHALNPAWQQAIAAADGQALLQAVLGYLAGCRAEGRLNNDGIPRMVRGYFYEMACVIQECARVLEPGGLVCMVNDNVRYAGASISVDLILTAIAAHLGLQPATILILPNGKGNSSQQMGEHGRDPLRKSIYIWRKP